MTLRKLKKLAGSNIIANKKEFKQSSGECKVCHEQDSSLLDVHRIVPGKDGGKYTKNNSVTLCCKCHRLVHADKIEIIGWFDSTAGRLLHIKKDGIEDFI